MGIIATSTIITNEGVLDASSIAQDSNSFQLLSYNLDEVTLLWNPIANVTTETVQNTITINFVSGNSITCRPTQSIFELGMGFVEASQLQSLDRVVGIEKNEIVLNVQTNILPATVYNFIASTNNNYFANGILISD